MAEKEFKIQNGLRVLEEAYLESSLDVSGTVTANTFVGDGSGLTGLPSIPSIGSGTTEDLSTLLDVPLEIGYWENSGYGANTLALTPYGTINNTAIASFNNLVPGGSQFTISYANTMMSGVSTTFTKTGAAENFMGMGINIPIQYVSGSNTISGSGYTPSITYGTASAGKFLTNDGSTVSWGTVPSGGVTLDGTESLTNKTITNSSFKGTLYDSMMTSGNQGMFIQGDGMGSFSWSNLPILTTNGGPILPSNAGIVPAEYLVRIDQNRSLTNNVGANNIFDSGNTQITLEPDTLYYVKGIVHAQKPASSSAGIATYRFNFNSGAPQSFIMTNVYFESSSIATNFVTSGQTTQLRKTDGTSSYSMVLVQNATTSAMNAVSMFDGWIKTNQTNTTTLALQMQHSTTGSSTGITVYPDTYIMIKPYTGISSGATLVSGPWS